MAGLKCQKKRNKSTEKWRKEHNNITNVPAVEIDSDTCCIPETETIDINKEAPEGVVCNPLTGAYLKLGPVAYILEAQEKA